MTGSMVVHGRVLYLDCQGSKKIETLNLVWAFEIQSLLLVKHFPQQGHIYTNKITPPNPSQIGPLPNDQAFQYMSLWGQVLLNRRFLLHKKVV